MIHLVNFPYVVLKRCTSLLSSGVEQENLERKKERKDRRANQNSLGEKVDNVIK